MFKQAFSIAALTACFSLATAANGTEIIMTSEVATTHWKTQYMQAFADRVGERTQGAVKAKLFAGGQLYNDQDAMAALGTGAVHMVWPVTVRVESVDPRAGVINLPFAISDAQMDNACFKSGLTKMISSYVEPRNLQVLDFLRAADMFFVFRDKNVKVMEDLRNTKVRVTGGRVFLDMMRGLGTSPVSMAASEMSTALAQGAIDGIFTSPAGWAEMIGPTGKYAWHVPGLSIATYAVVVDKGWMASLPDDHRQAIIETITEIGERQWREAMAADEKLIKRMTDGGAAFNVADEAEKARLQKSIAGGLKTFTDRYPETVEQLAKLRSECEVH